MAEPLSAREALRESELYALLDKLEGGAEHKKWLLTAPPEQIPWFSPEELRRENCGQVPAEPGVYYVLLPEGEPRFRPDPRGGYDPAELERRCKNSGGKCLFSGKASAKSGGLRARLRQYMRCGYAGGKNHRGGRTIWQVEQLNELRISWQICPRANELERKTLQCYRQLFGVYPVANRRG